MGLRRAPRVNQARATTAAAAATIAVVAAATVGAATTIAVGAGINPAMIQVAEIEATAAAADLTDDRRAITVQRPCAAAPMATVVITAEIAPSIIRPGAFALRIAEVIEVKTEIAAAIKAETRAKIRIGTKTEIAAVTRAATRAEIRIGTETKIATETRIAVVIGAAIAIEIAIKIA